MFRFAIVWIKKNRHGLAGPLCGRPKRDVYSAMEDLPDYKYRAVSPLPVCVRQREPWYQVQWHTPGVSFFCSPARYFHSTDRPFPFARSSSHEVARSRRHVRCSRERHPRTQQQRWRAVGPRRHHRGHRFRRFWVPRRVGGRPALVGPDDDHAALRQLHRAGRPEHRRQGVPQELPAERQDPVSRRLAVLRLQGGLPRLRPDPQGGHWHLQGHLLFLRRFPPGESAMQYPRHSA
ncbi:hypothetical protein VTK73DRAFT_7521 [Phialemonium thermophilum]|uniref:Uncharacterized protein n=1 Tax=Phialemonium thermophilum TaxID=223376 RepID=A0ABR3WDY1_9PEZI